MPTLISRNVAPTGGFPFQDPKLGKKYDGYSFDFKGLVSTIIKDRKANPRIYPVEDTRAFDYDIVAQEVENYIWNNAKPQTRQNYFQDAKPPTTESPQIVSGKVCEKCNGTNIVDRLCRTCGGRKVIGYTCRDCNWMF